VRRPDEAYNLVALVSEVRDKGCTDKTAGTGDDDLHDA
jgi:hypothetical protein